MAGISPRKLFDTVSWSVATEFERGRYLDLSEPLPGYPLFNQIVQRSVFRATPTIREQIVKPNQSSGVVYSVGQPKQTSAPKLSDSFTLAWGGRLWTTVYYPQEQAFNGIGTPEGIVDVIAARKVQFDAYPRRDYEQLWASAAGSATQDDCLTLRQWLPPSLTATDLEINGGADITAKEYLSGPTVATLPEWGHAVCGFDTLQNDLLTKIDEFMDRVNYYEPDGSLNIIPGSPSRIGILNQRIYSQWKDLQDVANDDLQDDLGMWRSAVHYRSVPFINLPAWTENVPSKPSGEAFVYLLDMNAIRLWVHSDYNFKLDPPYYDWNDADATKLSRQAWVQLVCLSRRNHLVARTTQPTFIL